MSSEPGRCIDRRNRKKCDKTGNSPKTVEVPSKVLRQKRKSVCDGDKGRHSLSQRGQQKAKMKDSKNK